MAMTKKNRYGVKKDTPGNSLLGYIDPRRYIEYKDFLQMPDDQTAPSNCSQRAFQVEVKYEDDKKYDN